MLNLRRIIRLAIDNVIKEGITDVDLFSPPFELKYLKIDEVKKRITDLVEKQIQDFDFKSLKMKKIGSVLIPKKEFFDFRKCALIDPIDEIKYLSIVLVMARDIEIGRINKSKNKIFSYRYLPKNGYLFDSKYSFTKFRNYISEKSKKRSTKVVVECDISSFYDRLNLHRLESNLRAIPNIDHRYIDLLNELLLFWANRDSYGLPIGSNGSRILAESALIEVDNYLISQKIDFCRFVDDYRIFAKDAITAHHWLSLLVKKLSDEGLFLNTIKTKIKDVSKIKEQNQDETDDSENVLPTDIIDEEDEKEQDFKNAIPKIIRGYSGLIPTKFRKMTQSESDKIALENELELLNSLKSNIIIEPKEIIKFIKLIIAKEKFELFAEMPNILEKFPQFLPYLTDVLLKYQDKIDNKTCESIKDCFSNWFEKENISEYILVYLTRFFKEGKFEDKDTLFKYFRNLKRNAGSYIGRALLEALENKLSRGEILEIKDNYVRADLWEKRQIIKMVSKKLSKGEKRVFFKDIKIHTSDILSEFIISEKKEFLKLLKIK